MTSASLCSSSNVQDMFLEIKLRFRVGGGGEKTPPAGDLRAINHEKSIKTDLDA